MDKFGGVRTFIGVILLYLIIQNIFSFLAKLTTFFIRGISAKAFYAFILWNGLWIVVAAAAIIVLGKRYGGTISELMTGETKDSVLSLTGIIVIVDGAIALAGVLPAYVINAANTFQLGTTIPEGTEAVYLDTFISNAASVLIMTCQILFGFYFIKRSKRQ